MRKIIAAISSGLSMFMLAGLYTGVIAKGFMTNNVDPAIIRVQPNMWLIVAGYLLLGFLMTLIYPYVKGSTPPSLKSGAVFGVVTGVVWMMPYSLVLFGVYRFPYLAIPVDFVWALIEQGIGGLVMSAVLRGRSASSVT